ncbi:flagellar motor protein MotB [Rhodovibrio salinarum]|uniref:Motility protein MotB n=1 Tax=Rhodovibrio salinarum TaxID=1087 RepID=A0A934V0Q7_9PROT|nr:flagellar motor protein MotB [Rhodovibrio salinarum]MBK1697886.1 motility protein MotB [Rhodovibrio salinarum]
MAEDSNRPIIVIKKKKKGGHGGHHGGAWKVAYADFVTAMMAFFLLLWLISATTEEQKEGIADYFTPNSVTLSDSGSGKILSGRTMSDEGALISDRAPVGVNMSLPSPSGPANEEEVQDLAKELAEREQRDFEEAERKLKAAMAAVPELAELADQVLVDHTPEGMRIQLVDARGNPMFKLGSAEPKAHTRELLRLVAETIQGLPNQVAVKGHTDATPFNGGGDYSNWELSADRANASRRVLQQAGLDGDRVGQVVGRAAQDPLVPDDPDSPRNRRISIILLNQNHQAEAMKQATGAGEREPNGLQNGPSIIRDEPNEQ